MSTQRFESNSRAEAAILACEALGLTRKEIKYKVVSETGELMTRKVVIEVEVPEGHAPAAAAEPSDDAPRRPRREPRGRGPKPAAQSADAPAPAQPQAAAAPSDEDEDAQAARAQQRYDEQRESRPRNDGEGGGSRRGRRGGRGGGRNNNQGEREPREAREPREPREHREPREPRNAGHDAPRPPRQPRAPRPSQADNGVDNLLKLIPAPPSVPRQEAIEPQGPRAKRAVEVCSHLISLMGLAVDTILVEESPEELQVHLYGKDEERFIGKKGEVLLALQFIINRMLSRSEEEGEQLLTLDAGGFRQRRRLALEQLARTLAERAVAESKAVRLSPMSAHDRRVFHLALKEVETVTTRSEGDGMFRNLLIIPAEFVA